VIKAVREVTSLGLKEAKASSMARQRPVKEGREQDEAAAIKKSSKKQARRSTSSKQPTRLQSSFAAAETSKICGRVRRGMLGPERN